MEMDEIRLGLLGFGRVNQAFLQLLANKINTINQLNLQVKIVGVSTQTHGNAINPAGIDAVRLFDAYQSGQSLEKFHTQKRINNALEFVNQLEADVIIESMELNPETGQPAVDCLRAALTRNMHIITANKSAPAFAHAELSTLAQHQKRAFLFEGTVLDGAPIFSFVRETLPATQILGFQGVVNSTTNFILTSMEEGLPLEDALRQAQALGIAEKNPDYDLDGKDAAVKTAILVNALLGGSTQPNEITCTGIRHLTPRTVIEAARQGRRFKLIAEAHWRDGKIAARVTPKMVPLTNPLAHVHGTAAALILLTDTLGEVTIQLSEGETSQTAYALLADLITVIKRYDFGQRSSQ